LRSFIVRLVAVSRSGRSVAGEATGYEQDRPDTVRRAAPAGASGDAPISVREYFVRAPEHSLTLELAREVSARPGLATLHTSNVEACTSGRCGVDYSGYQTIAVERRERVLRLTLNRPEALNAIDGQLHDELARIFFDVGMDEDADVVVLTGAGRAFCAGGDMAWLQSLIEDPYGWQRVAIEGKRIVLGILEARQPVIAQIQGPAVGLGATIALACDVTFAAEGARIGDPHVSVGLVAGDGGTALWPALVGYARARELLYSGELIEAERAAAIGLVGRARGGDRPRQPRRARRPPRGGGRRLRAAARCGRDARDPVDEGRDQPAAAPARERQPRSLAHARGALEPHGRPRRGHRRLRRAPRPEVRRPLGGRRPDGPARPLQADPRRW
jgi:enoyl-CoA hydratase